MPETYHVLLVEDDEKLAGNYSELLEAADLGGDGRIICKCVSSFDDAECEIASRKPDLLVLDVRDAGTENEVAGRQLFERLRATMFPPVIFHTALPGAVQDLEGVFVRVITKDDPQQLRDAVIEELRRPVTAFLKRLGGELREILWRFHDEITDGGSRPEDDDLVYLLVRRIAYVMSRETAERIYGAEDVDGDKRCIRPVEMFVTPPSPDFRQAGDIILIPDEPTEEGTGDDRSSITDEENGEAGGALCIILTPTCDLVNRKASVVLLAELVPADSASGKPADQVRRIVNQSSAGQNAKAIEAAARLVNQDIDSKYFFLPAIPQLNHIAKVVDFTRLRTLSRAELDDKEPIATLDSPFRENLLSRFANYMNRHGTPVVDPERVAAGITGDDGADQ